MPANAQPTTTLDRRFSDASAAATPWERARDELDKAATYWLSTVRPDGRPHVTTLIAVWHDGALYFCTGPDEQKAKNLEKNTQVVLTTGRSSMDEGLDVVVEGEAVNVTDNATLRAVAQAYEQKYGSEWHFDVRDGAFHHEAGHALVFQVAPTTAFGFAKGTFGQTRWRF